MKKLLLSFTAAALVGFAAAPANADIRVGTLHCYVSPGVSFVVGSSKGLQCNFHGVGQPRDRYAGYINRVGLDVGYTTGGHLAWIVFAPSRPGPGALGGAYIGGSAEASVGAGVSGNALVGGLNNSITLQPFSVGAQGGLDVALTASGLRLDWVHSGPVRKKKKRVRRG
jgi:hypothetical protein